MPTIIYTVITGNYDTIKQPLVVEEGVEYVLFTNNPGIMETKFSLINKDYFI